MPAIRFYCQCVYQVADYRPSSKAVEVRARDGQYVTLPWFGMICEPAARLLPGLGYAKIRAVEITDGDGVSLCRWRRLQAGEHVLGWRSLAHSTQPGIYGVVDRDGWPLVVGDRGRKGAPTLVLLQGAKG